MCGIYGILRLDDSHGNARSDLSAMAAVTVHRGPDDEGTFADGPLAMGMRRLSIIDVESGHQPLCNEDGSVWVVCNGEIYNFRELTTELTKRGHQFATGSDVEVIVHLYEEFGDACVEWLRGMFAFALWDKNRKRLLIGRDRLGIKPLYLARQGSRLIFASELKAVLAITGAQELDRTAIHEYLTLGYVPAPLTMFQGIEKLEPGSLLRSSEGQVEKRRYWTPVASDKQEMAEAEWTAELRRSLASSVRRQLVSDVPLGAFLSGGLDSSTVVAMMAEAGADPIRTYAIGFGGDAAGEFYNELPYAAAVAKRFGGHHREILVEPDVVDLLPKLLWYMDEPVADSAFVTTYLVAKFARDDVKVILSGAGGDELFGGYRRYLGEHYGAMFERIPAAFRRKVMRPIASRLPGDRHSGMLNAMRLAKTFILSHDLSPEDRYLAYVSAFGQSDIAGLITGGVQDSPASSRFLDAYEGLGTSDPVQRCMVVDLKTQLPDDILMLTDRMTMATSLECRVPLLDEELVDLALRMPASMKVRGRRLKHVLKEAMAETLPAHIIDRGKRGFGAPMGAWLKGRLLDMTAHFLSPSSIERRGLFEPQAVRALMDAHVRSQDDNTDKLLALLNLEIWARLYIDGQSPDAMSKEIEARVA